MTNDIPDDPHAREAAFHDRWANNSDLARVPVRAAFEAPTALEHAFILRQMGALRGRRVLDLGSGLGEAAVYFAIQGADVTAIDLSPEMVVFSQRLARNHGVSIRGVVSPAETLEVPDEQFDFVYAGNLLHHVHDKRRVFAEVRRVLRPQGRFFSWDPLAYNPVIAIYRRLATEVRTPDEAPLTFEVVDVLVEYLDHVGHREFWVTGLSLFLKYFLVDRVNPNTDRYWKRILDETPRSLWWWRPLARADATLTRLPLVRRLAWNMVMWGTKGGVPR